MLLLQAALCDGEEALAAFAEWRDRVDYERVLDGGSFRLLPLVQWNMKRVGCTDPVIARLAGVYRHSWCAVQQRMRQAAQVIAMLEAQDIRVLVAKGVPLARDFYASPGLRPMSDIDLVVPQDKAAAAVTLLREQGWTIPDAISAERFTHRRDDLLAMQCAIALKDSAGTEIDLHWRMINECRKTEVERRFWQQSEAMQLEGQVVRRPSATHLLFHVIVHALKPEIVPPMRWIADAAMILRRDAERIDWHEMAWLAKASSVRQRLGQGIAFLHQSMRLDLPPAALALIEGRACLVERIEQRAFRADLALRPTSPLLIQRAAVFARLATGAARGQLPGLAARWLGRRVMPRIAGSQ